MIPRCLTIAGSDSGGGAGIQADLKAFAAAGCYGMSAIVALTAQNTTGVTAVHEVPPVFVRAQLDAVLGDLGADAAKTGMLFSREVIETVADTLAAGARAARGRPGDDRQLRREAASRRCGRDARGPSLSACDRRDAEPPRGGGSGRRPGLTPRARRADSRSRRARRRRHRRSRGHAGRSSLRRGAPRRDPGRRGTTSLRRTERAVRIRPRLQQAWPGDCPWKRPRERRHGSRAKPCETDWPSLVPATDRWTFCI